MHPDLPRRHRAVPINNQMGLGHDRFDAALGAWASDSGFSESNHRQFYGRWAQLMAADSWAEISVPVAPAKAGAQGKR
ncbi:MAG: hypothetical protein JO139_00325 [Alphaproteobacteria bacterium]|nr:hypothetical protein [Alphaproteobacteria bacterium]